MRPVTRVTPALPARAYQTYRVASPPATHFRPAGCAEVDCPSWRHGWRTVVDEQTDLGMRQAAYICSECVPELLAASPAGRGRRRYTESRSEAGLTVFTFPAGQPCFEAHRVRLERPELYIVRGGDWRGQLGPLRRHTRPEDWVEDFATHQQKLADTIQKG